MPKKQVTKDKLLFVQFLHPGDEHTPCHTKGKHIGNHICWNTGEHKRKFLKNPGRYLEGNKPVDSDLIFWGEWEPQSDVIKTLIQTKPEYPKYLYQPYYWIPPNQQNLQNTDPFVFGKQFYYVCCQQDKYPQLKFLKQGSVILFGSKKSNKPEESNKFVLDTVFVVDYYYNSLLNNRSDIDNLKNKFSNTYKVSDAYIDVTLSRILDNNCNNDCSQSSNNCNKGCSPSSTTNYAQNSGYRLYFGATFKNQINGMFSFFPCLPYDENRQEGFARPEIIIPGVINPNLSQGVKFTPNSKSKTQASIVANKIHWDDVKSQVQQQGLKLGIHTALPPKK
jgi:hypothetical protein